MSKQKTPQAKPLTLQFGGSRDSDGCLEDVSAAIAIGNDLWLASDETCTLERLSWLDDDTYGNHVTVRLDDYLALPAGPDEEIDIEGLDFDGRYLWLIGSHSLKRAKVRDDGADNDSISQLAEMVRETNRYLVARIPVILDPESGCTELGKSVQDPKAPGKLRTAAQLFGTGQENMLISALRLDPHLGRFLAIPCKENGFDVEGIAVLHDRVFLGLRGPVLGGWAVLLELELEAIAPDTLKLVPITKSGSLYKKHFFDLCGLGIRDLAVDGEDLLILAGPTMDLDGHVLVYRWSDLPKKKKECIVREKDLTRELEFRFADREPGTDHPEGITLIGSKPRRLLVVYDSPAPHRLKRKDTLLVDTFPFK